ncbi:uncharacterized protein LOC118756963 [Rhagoletis pomonella]|uniref:uncharacterized protein LOC118756963 n=1 Tax=Rhagoletis pomonella TaxID=28610 RepID=UPI00177B3064|nr:uncharacterized protein LOC118756963 [Rhagoletis pomonella]
MKTRSGAELKQDKSEDSTDDEGDDFKMANSSSTYGSLDVRRPDPLKFDGNVAEQWRVFKQNFDIYAIAIDLEERKEQQKVGIFLNACGPETIEIFNTFGLTVEQKKNYDAVFAAVENYCTPKKNEVYEAFRFNSRKQEEGEPFESYLLDLRKRVKHCGYTDMDRMIRDNIVIGTNSQKLQKKLLETENLTLSRAIEIARAAELVDKYTNEMQQQSKCTTVNAIRSHKQISQNSGARNTIENTKSLSKENVRVKHNSRQSANCKFCKGVHEFGKCPAFGKKCNNCGRLNHFSVACYSSQVHEIKESDEKRESGDDIVLHNIEDLSVGRKRWYEKIRVNDCLINFKLDTGADVNILPYKYFIKYMKNTMLYEGGLPPRSYSGAELDYKGVIQCLVMCRNEIKTLQFTVVDTPYEPLLGLSACEQLNLIKRVNVIREATRDEFIRNYRDVFEGTGCFVTNLDIQVKKNSVPVVKPARRIPQSLAEKVKK